MKKPGMIVLTINFVFFFAGLLTLVNAQPTLSSNVLNREINPSVDHNHCTTRQFQHKTFFHEGVWFVFYSDGLAMMYSRSVNKSDLGKPLSVMVSVCNLNDN